MLGTAVGPALGGALTQAFDWRAIFLFQVPVALAAAGASLAARGRVAREPAIAEPAQDARSLVARSGGAGALVALAALSAALTAVLFLLVLLLVSGWSLEPLAAAAAVSVLPLAAFAGARIRGPAAVRASAGCALVGAGVLALAVLPGAAIAWIVAPQILAGTGMGMALPALAGELLPGRTPGQAAWLLTVRHAGITLALVLIAPIVAAQLDGAVSDARERGAALVLDARLPPLEKVELAGPLVAKLDTVNPRDALRAALDAEAARFADDPEQRREYAELTERADETLVAGIEDSFRIAFVIAGVLALAGAFAVLPREPRSRTIALAVTAAALALPGRARGGSPRGRARARGDRRPVRGARASGHRRDRRVRAGRGAGRARPRGVPLRVLARGARARAGRRGRRACLPCRARRRPALDRRAARHPRHQPGLSSQRSGTHGAAASAARSSASPANGPSSRRASQPTATDGAANGHGLTAKRAVAVAGGTA